MTTSEAAQRQRTAGLSWYDLVLEDEHPVPEDLRAPRIYPDSAVDIPVARRNSQTRIALARLTESTASTNPSIPTSWRDKG